MEMRFNIRASAVAAGVTLAMLAGHLAQAHHSIPSFYDAGKTISVTGVVKELKIMNPHSEIILEGAEPNGEKGTWLAVMGSVTALRRNGWSNDTIKAGTTVTIEGNPARAAGAKGMIVISITMPDGRTIKPGQVD
jgi:hypothetical protein